MEIQVLFEIVVLYILDPVLFILIQLEVALNLCLFKLELHTYIQVLFKDVFQH